MTYIKYNKVSRCQKLLQKEMILDLTGINSYSYKGEEEIQIFN